jgi:hypothetical protein
MMLRAMSPIYWPSDAVLRAATAIREANSTDIFVLARRTLEAAIRNEADLLALLPLVLSAAPRPQQALGRCSLIRSPRRLW